MFDVCIFLWSKEQRRLNAHRRECIHIFNWELVKTVSQYPLMVSLALAHEIAWAQHCWPLVIETETGMKISVKKIWKNDLCSHTFYDRWCRTKSQKKNPGSKWTLGIIWENIKTFNAWTFIQAFVLQIRYSSHVISRHFMTRFPSNPQVLHIRLAVMSIFIPHSHNVSIHVWFGWNCILVLNWVSTMRYSPSYTFAVEHFSERPICVNLLLQTVE